MAVTIETSMVDHPKPYELFNYYTSMTRRNLWTQWRIEQFGDHKVAPRYCHNNKSNTIWWIIRQLFFERETVHPQISWIILYFKMKTYSQFLSFFHFILLIPFFIVITSASNELLKGTFKGIELTTLAYQVNYVLHSI